MTPLEQAVVEAAESRQFGAHRNPAKAEVARKFGATRSRINYVSRDLGVSKPKFKDSATHNRK